MHFLSEISPIKRISNAAAAAQTLITSSAFSMANHDRVLILVALGTVTNDCALTLTLQVENAAGSFVNTLAKVLHTAATSSNKLLVLDVARPRSLESGECKVTLARADQNAAVDGIFAIPYSEREAPITDDDSVAAIARFTSAADAS